MVMLEYANEGTGPFICLVARNRPGDRTEGQLKLATLARERDTIPHLLHYIHGSFRTSHRRGFTLTTLDHLKAKCS